MLLSEDEITPGNSPSSAHKNDATAAPPQELTAMLSVNKDLSRGVLGSAQGTVRAERTSDRTSEVKTWAPLRAVRYRIGTMFAMLSPFKAPAHAEERQAQSAQGTRTREFSFGAPAAPNAAFARTDNGRFVFGNEQQRTAPVPDVHDGTKNHTEPAPAALAQANERVQDHTCFIYGRYLVGHRRMLPSVLIAWAMCLQHTPPWSTRAQKNRMHP
jgi:hypothetical protein